MSDFHLYRSHYFHFSVRSLVPQFGIKNMLCFLGSVYLFCNPAFAQLSTDAADFIHNEAPTIKLKLSGLLNEEEQHQLIRDFVDTVHGMFCWEPKQKEEVSKLLENELVDLSTIEQWQSRVPKLTVDQEFVKELYSKEMKVSWGDEYLAQSWLSQLEIELNCVESTQQCIRDTFKTYGVIQLRDLTKSKRPKLVIACGNRTKTEPSRSYHPNPHFEDDTIKILPSNHYQTVFDEGIIHLNVGQWREVERVLKPGGFFIGYSYMSQHGIPSDSRMKPIGVIGIESKYGCPGSWSVARSYSSSFNEWRIQWGLLIFSKPYIDGSYPMAMSQEDMPHGMELTEQYSMMELDSKLPLEVHDLSKALNNSEGSVQFSVLRDGRPFNFTLEMEGVWYTSIRFPGDLGSIQFYSDEAITVAKLLLMGSSAPTQGHSFRCGLYKCSEMKFRDGNGITVYTRDAPRLIKAFGDKLQ